MSEKFACARGTVSSEFPDQNQIRKYVKRTSKSEHYE